MNTVESLESLDILPYVFLFEKKEKTQALIYKTQKGEKSNSMKIHELEF